MTIVPTSVRPDLTASVRPEPVEGPFFFACEEKEERCFDKLSANGSEVEVGTNGFGDVLP